MRLTQLLGITMLIGMFACGASARQTALSGAYTTATAGAAGLVAFDAKHEQDIVAAAPDEPTGKQQLADYRAARAKAELAIDTLLRAIAAAAVLNNDQSLAAVVQAGITVNQALAALGVKL